MRTCACGDPSKEGTHSPTACVQLACEWFALCDNIATKTITHPILGDVPVCDRCYAKATA